jgi:hypothetical protein
MTALPGRETRPPPSYLTAAFNPHTVRIKSLISIKSCPRHGFLRITDNNSAKLFISQLQTAHTAKETELNFKSAFRIAVS